MLEPGFNETRVGEPKGSSNYCDEDKKLGDSTMRILLTSISVLIVVCGQATASPVLPGTVNFDDIAETLDTYVPDGYAGFDWDDFLSYTVSGSQGFDNGIVSPGHAAYGGYSGSLDGTVPSVPGVITSDIAFDFSSANIGSAYYDGLTVTVEGYLNGSFVASQAVVVNATDPAPLAFFGFQNVDELRFISSTSASTTDALNCGASNCTHFTVDNLAFAPATVVPVPAAVWLFGSGVMGLAGWGRKRRR